MAVTYEKGFSLDDGIRIVPIDVNGVEVKAYINTGDATFPEKVLSFQKWLEISSDELKKEDPMQKKPEEFTPGGIMSGDTLNELEAFLEKRRNVCAEACKRLNAIFGEGLCEKLFPYDIPDEVKIMELIDGLTPFIENAFAERGKKISVKYNRNRKGGRTQRSKAELIADYRAEHGEQI